MITKAIKQHVKDIAQISFLIMLIILPGSLVSIPTVIWISKKLDFKLISIDFKSKKKQTSVEH